MCSCFRCKLPPLTRTVEGNDERYTKLKLTPIELMVTSRGLNALAGKEGWVGTFF